VELESGEREDETERGLGSPFKVISTIVSDWSYKTG